MRDQRSRLYTFGFSCQSGYARGLAESVAGSAVTINSVLPGPTRSEGVEGFIKDLARTQGTDTAAFEKEFFRTVRPSSVIKRFIEPDEVTSLVAYACSPLAAVISGASLRVDGGVVRSIA